jgi:hypothetical protein
MLLFKLKLRINFCFVSDQICPCFSNNKFCYWIHIRTCNLMADPNFSSNQKLKDIFVSVFPLNSNTLNRYHLKWNMSFLWKANIMNNHWYSIIYFLNSEEWAGTNFRRTRHTIKVHKYWSWTKQGSIPNHWTDGKHVGRTYFFPTAEKTSPSQALK